MHLNKMPRHRPYQARPRRRPWLYAAPLAACLTAACASAALGGTPATAGSAPLNCGPSGSCLSPQAYETAYGVTPLLRHGIDGRGETVAMPELAQTPASHGSPTDIRKDLAAFDAKFGLPRATVHVVPDIAGSPAPYLANDEEVGDAEMVHAFAPGATLDIILIPADAISSPADFAAAITKAIRESTALHTAVLSISASGGEHSFTRAEVAAMHAALEQARDQHVTVLGSSGDNGVIASQGGASVQVSLPASDPLVLGVGGTILDATPAPTWARWRRACGSRAASVPAGSAANLRPGPSRASCIAYLPNVSTWSYLRAAAQEPARRPGLAQWSARPGTPWRRARRSSGQLRVRADQGCDVRGVEELRHRQGTGEHAGELVHGLLVAGERAQ